MKRSILPIFIPHLGCKHACVFCDQRTIAAPRAPTPLEVRCQIESQLAHADCPQIAFYGGSFTALPLEEQAEYLAVAAELVARGQCSGIRLSTRPDALGPEVLALLGRFPVDTIELGVQSMDDRVLAASGRGHTAQDARQAARAVQQAGLELVLQMMTGLPEAMAESDLQTARALAELAPQGVRIYPTCVIGGTPLHRMYQAGAYKPQSLEAATQLAAQALDIFEQAGIPALRIGLNPTEALSNGGVVAGPYHPAMGELVRGRRLRNLAQAALDALPPMGRVSLSVPAGRGPLMRGQKNCNTRYLAQRYPGLDISICETPGQQQALRALVQPV